MAPFQLTQNSTFSRPEQSPKKDDKEKKLNNNNIKAGAKPLTTNATRLLGCTKANLKAIVERSILHDQERIRQAESGC
ncbi:hypothetical protein M5689_019841 [Euphorbia peplus]|nr:hypothetical protein M5689_019841 [Euphorbia peplus]